MVGTLETSGHLRRVSFDDCTVRDEGGRVTPAGACDEGPCGAYGTWRPYGGSSSILLAVVLLIVTGALFYCAIRLHYPLEVKRPGKFLRVTLVVLWLLSVTTFLVAAGIYVRALYQQVGPFTGPVNPITPVTVISGVVAFFIIVNLVARNGLWVAFGSAIVGTIAAPMIFELPFDLIVMWRTYPPAPEIPLTLLFFLPLFLARKLPYQLPLT